jgi:hypothetical protein
MANGLYAAFRNGQLGSYTTMVDWDADTVRVAFVDTGVYTVNLTTHDFFDDLEASNGEYPAGTYNTAGQTLDSKTVGTLGTGVADAADELFSAFSNGSVSLEGIVIWKQGASSAASPLICWFDTGITGMPFTPSGGDVTIAWNASGIFSF